MSRKLFQFSTASFSLNWAWIGLNLSDENASLKEMLWMQTNYFRSYITRAEKKISLFTLMREIYRVLCFPRRRLQIDSAEKWGDKNILIVGYHKGK